MWNTNGPQNGCKPVICQQFLLMQFTKKHFSISQNKNINKVYLWKDLPNTIEKMSFLGHTQNTVTRRHGMTMPWWHGRRKRKLYYQTMPMSLKMTRKQALMMMPLRLQQMCCKMACNFKTQKYQKNVDLVPCQIIGFIDQKENGLKAIIHLCYPQS